MSKHGREPRTGLTGVWDRIVGPGTSAAENAGTAVGMILGAAIGLAGDPPHGTGDLSIAAWRP